MSKLITENGEQERLNEFCVGKVIAKIKCEFGHDIQLQFSDGSIAYISNIGGIYELKNTKDK